MRFSVRIAVTTALALAALIPAVWVLAGPADVGSAQRDQLKSLASEMREKMDRVRGELVRARMELFQAYRAYQLDDCRVKAAMERIGKAQLALLNLHLDNQIELRRILNESQFEEFRRKMGRFGGRMAGVLGPHDDGPMDRPPDKVMLERIGAGPDQVRRIWREADAPEKKAVLNRLVRDSKRLIELYSRYDLDVDAARKLVDGIHRSQMDLADLNHKWQQTLRSVLTEQQFDRLQQELSKMFRPREHRRRLGGRF